MLEAYPRDVIREAEKSVVKAASVDALMKKAAGAVCDAAVEFWMRSGQVPGQTTVLGLVGGGDNGGDCLYALAYLADLGFQTQAAILHQEVHQRALKRAEAAGVKIAGPDLTQPPGVVSKQVIRWASEARIWIDGLVGTGISGPLRAPLAQVIGGLRTFQSRSSTPVLVVAIDLPSGISADDGHLDSTPLSAQVTVSMGGFKSASFLPPACHYWGEVQLVDLGLNLPPAKIFQLQAADVGAFWVRPGRLDHKYTRGVVQVVAGSSSYPLTGVMCVGGASRSGAGMVRFAGPEEATFAVLSDYPETVIKSGRYQSLLVGPGIDLADRDRAEEAVFLSGQAVASRIPLVLDAGGLDLYQRIRRTAPDGKLDYHAVLTPHAGEAAKLLTELGAGSGRGGISRAEVEEAPLRWASKLAELTASTVVLKGAVTVVVSSQGTVFSYLEGTSWAGTAGSGDVLAGVIASVLAGQTAKAQIQGRNLSADQVALAAGCGVWVHGKAARLAAGIDGFGSRANDANWQSAAPGAPTGDLAGGLAGGLADSAAQVLPWGHPIIATDICRYLPAAIGLALEAARQADFGATGGGGRV